jgi:hypothetical protein
MEKIIITEEQIKKALETVLINEEISKVSRQDFNRIQFKIEELQNSLNETQKEFMKLQGSMPSGLKNATNKRMMSISSYLIGAQGNITKLKDIVKQYKRKVYTPQIPQPTEV